MGFFFCFVCATIGTEAFMLIFSPWRVLTGRHLKFIKNNESLMSAATIDKAAVFCNKVSVIKWRKIRHCSIFKVVTNTIKNG